ncbi:MAG: hypothetical protein JWN07_70 [Hyphomicrobiales bacterium]|nr:hypothetical protein [Hyphomicrobiales bacterium]
MALTGLKAVTLLAGLAGAIAAPGVAQAQFFFDTWGGRFDVPLDDGYGGGYDRPYREAAPISRREIASMLARRGYQVNPSIARSNDVYLVEAVDPGGRRVRLAIDAYDGSILRRSAAAPAPRALSRREDEPWTDDDGFGPPRAEPPRVIPGVGPAQRKPAQPKKPATARVEPKAPVAKPETAPAAPPAAPASARPAPTAAEQRPPAPPATASVEPAPAAGPRVIPLYKTPGETAPDKPADGAP